MWYYGSHMDWKRSTRCWLVTLVFLQNKKSSCYTLVAWEVLVEQAICIRRLFLIFKPPSNSLWESSHLSKHIFMSPPPRIVQKSYNKLDTTGPTQAKIREYLMCSISHSPITGDSQMPGFARGNVEFTIV